MSIAISIIGLGLLIVLHEGGHFIVARLCGMRVERFSIGFGPTLLGFKRGGTLFQIAPIPLGGFVQITGLNPNEEFDKADPMVYPNRPRWMRLAMVLAGPAANYLTAIVLAFIIFTVYGIGTKTTRIEEPLPNSPAATAGLKAGDILVAANGQPVDAEHPINEVIKASQGAPVNITVRRDGQEQTFAVTPYAKDGSYLVGINIGVERKHVPVGSAVKEAVVYPYHQSVFILVSLYDVIRGDAPGSLQGPIGITKEMAKAANRGMLSFLSILMVLSVYLGLFNLLPLPALDGGRAVFLGIESLIRRKVDPRIEAMVHTAGFVLLLGVLVVVSFKDIFGKG
jgi:regulator of sigma E protease